MFVKLEYLAPPYPPDELERTAPVGHTRFVGTRFCSGVFGLYDIHY
jgi:hypothetical protein